jgi:FAD-dependent urate hydroxylase
MTGKPSAQPAPIGLPALEERLRQDLAWLEWPAKSWVPPSHAGDARVLDVLIVGAGMCGLVASAALKGLGVTHQLAVDQAQPGREGPWLGYARMETLRSPKQLTGPALGLPALTFRAYYEARFGADAWETLGKIPRETWMEYLVWYRRVLDLPVANGCRFEGIELTPSGPDAARQPLVTAPLAVRLRDASGPRTVHVRHLVLATGRDGLGGPWLPDAITRLPASRRAHSADAIDFAALRGLRVAVIGAGASAMDNAATALEAGAAQVDMLIRRPALPRVNKFTGIGSQGVVHGFAGLPDAWKWRFLDHALRAQTPPPRDSMLRVSRHPNSRFFLGETLLDARMAGGEVELVTTRRTHRFDFVIAATGFSVDLPLRPELAAVAAHIRFWRDRFTPPAGEENPELAHAPDLGPGFEFQERVAGACPQLSRIHCFNYPALLSHGKLSGDIPAVSAGGERLARAIARALFVADRETHYAALTAYDVPELLGDEWTDAGAEPARHRMPATSPGGTR